MKALEILEKDHQEVIELFEEFEDAGEEAYQKKQDLFDQIRWNLEVHCRMEEELFYPVVLNIPSKEAKAMGQEAVEDHKQIKDFLDDLSLMQPEEEPFDIKVAELREAVEQHIVREETIFFAEVREHCSKEILKKLGAEMNEFKEYVKGEAA